MQQGTVTLSSSSTSLTYGWSTFLCVTTYAIHYRSNTSPRCEATKQPSNINSHSLILINGFWSSSMHSPPSDLQPSSFSSSLQNDFHSKSLICDFKTFSRSVHISPLLTIIFARQCFNIFLLSCLLLSGTLCFSVLDHLVWSIHKRTEPGGDASL